MATKTIDVGRRHLGLILILLALTLPPNASFSISPLVIPLSLPETSQFSGLSVASGRHNQPPLTSVLRMEADGDTQVDLDKNNGLATAYNIAKIASSMAWIVTAYVALSFHNYVKRPNKPAFFYVRDSWPKLTLQ